MENQENKPGRTMEGQKRTLDIFWIIDCSGSMDGDKIQSVNTTIKDLKPTLEEFAKNNPKANFTVRAIQFNDTAGWVPGLGPEPTPLDKFVWPDLVAKNGTNTVAALRLLASRFDQELMPRKGLRPVCVLLSDGAHTNTEEEYRSALREIEKLPWGSKSVRISIGIGDLYDETELLQFEDSKTREKFGVLQARSASDIKKAINMATTIALGVSVGANMNEVEDNDQAKTAAQSVAESVNAVQDAIF